MVRVFGPPPGLNQTSILEPFPGWIISGNATWPSQNQAQLVQLNPVLLRPATITGIAYFVVTASGNVNAGVFKTTDGTNFTLLGSSGSIAASGSSVMQTLTLTSSVNVAPANGVKYYLALAADNTTISVGRFAPFAVTSSFGKLGLAKASLFTLADFATAATQNYVPYLAAVTSG